VRGSCATAEYYVAAAAGSVDDLWGDSDAYCADVGDSVDDEGEIGDVDARQGAAAHGAAVRGGAAAHGDAVHHSRRKE